ncbi:LysR family transcriptional regulator [Paraburkholderia sp. CNPSo 3274]|uniref:LysR family transcriptional regulator n=1 Tax=Paraburkholderia sp. CNPSo 3274 TaxID=2940932 RepID=UPI0020B7D6B7|nr:LysR family transcriptional regulator [Paraburkholderia sp. CNPSo 3274]MCP3708705.1 LysR family transcriptional regulator [Paraburkholderia sp. CNPSo 3274]
MLDIEDLQTFVEVADAGGLTPAARRLGISKSVVSRRLARLEGELSVQLMSRTTRGATLTEAGAAFRDYAARICAELDLARETILPAGELRGHLRISAPVSFGATHLAPILAELAGRHPLLQLQTSFSDRFVDVVSEGFDAAIRIGYLADSSLIARRIGPIFGKLVASPAYIRAHGEPRTPGEIANHEVLSQNAETWRFRVDGRVMTINPRGRFTSNNGQALVAAALAGLGITSLPDFLTDEHVASGALVPIMREFPVPEAGIFVIRPPGAHIPRKVRVLIEMLIENFGARSHP